MNDTGTIIELKNIRKCYVGDTAVIEDFNLRIKRGEFVTFLGPSGCGKTTILRMIGGFETPTTGKILLDGEDISDLPPNKRPVNTVFQKYALFPHLNVYDNVAFGLKLKKMPKNERDEKVRHALEVVDMEGFEKRKIQTLSGGQQQRIAIARAIVNEPEVLLLDESLSALDYKMRKEMQMELKEMHEKLGITFIFVTHDQEEALTMSDKIVVIADGMAQQIGTPEEIYNEPSNAFVADFIGESNIFDGVMVGYHRASFCGAVFDCVDDYHEGVLIDAVIRPEDILIKPVGQGKVDGEILSCTFKGTFYEVIVLSGKNEIEVQSLTCPEKGTRVSIDVDPDNIHIIPYDTTINHFEGILNQEMQICFPDCNIPVDPLRLFPEASWDGEQLTDGDGQVMDVSGTEVEAFFDPADADLSDDASEGIVQGHILSMIYKGDHYSYVVRSKREQDYYVNDEDLWNLEDFVSIVIPADKISYHRKG